MPNYFIGDFIRDTRIRRGYTQEQLSFGICTTPSLSRIENGAQTPGKHILDALFERLGIDENLFEMFVSKEDIESYEAIQEITRSIAGYDYVKLEKQIERLERLIGNKTKSNLQQQYLVFAKGVLKKGQGAASQEVMELFMQAIHMTLPDFDGVNPVRANLLTYHEITIINNIAILYAQENRMEEALGLGCWLKEYMEKSMIDSDEKTIKYPMILYNLSNWLGKLSRLEEAQQIAETGIDFCIQYGNLVMLPLLISNKACILAEMGRLEEATKFFTQATVIFEATKQESHARKTADLCKKIYGIEI